jgi:hypothetical protein
MRQEDLSICRTAAKEAGPFIKGKTFRGLKHPYIQVF